MTVSAPIAPVSPPESRRRAGRRLSRAKNVSFWRSGSTRSSIALWKEFFLQKGNLLDKYRLPLPPDKFDKGNFVSPLIDSKPIPYEARSLPYIEEKVEYHVFEVLEPFKVQKSSIAPWFDQKGWGTQYYLYGEIKQLIKDGYLKEVPPK